MGVLVRPAEVSDCTYFIDIHCPELKGLPRRERLARCGWWGDEEACSFLLRLYRGLGGEVFVAELYGEVIGEVEVLPHDDCLLGPRAYVNVLWVRGDARGKGVGRALIVAASEWAKGKGYERLDTIPEEWSVTFYRKLGFRLVATQCKAEKRLVRRGVIPSLKGCEEVRAQDTPSGKTLVAGTYRPGLFSWFVAWFDTYTRYRPPTAYEVKYPSLKGGAWVALMDWFHKGRASLIAFTQGEPGIGEFRTLVETATQIALTTEVEDLFIQTWEKYVPALKEAGYAILKTNIPWMSLRV